MRASFIAVIVAIGVVIALIYSSIFIVTPTQQALVLQFGDVRNAIRDPGPKFKVPFIQDVVFLDKRILDLNVPVQEIIAADQKRLVVDAFARYRIENPVLFYQSVNNIAEGSNRLSTFVQSSLRAVLADATFEDIVRDDRPQLMQRIRQTVQLAASNIGMEVVDVKIRRADLPEANSQAIFRRMETERQQEAEQIRAEGEEAARRIRAQAERQATVIRALANQRSEQLRGEGDAGRNAIFADAFGRDTAFFRFYRSMQAYERGLQSGDTRLVISPTSDFFRYFNDPRGAIEIRVSPGDPLPAPTGEPLELPELPQLPELDDGLTDLPLPGESLLEEPPAMDDGAAEDGAMPADEVLQPEDQEARALIDALEAENEAAIAEAEAEARAIAEAVADNAGIGPVPPVSDEGGEAVR